MEHAGLFSVAVTQFPEALVCASWDNEESLLSSVSGALWLLSSLQKGLCSAFSSGNSPSERFQRIIVDKPWGRVDLIGTVRHLLGGPGFSLLREAIALGRVWT